MNSEGLEWATTGRSCNKWMLVKQLVDHATNGRSGNNWSIGQQLVDLATTGVLIYHNITASILTV